MTGDVDEGAWIRRAPWDVADLIRAVVLALAFMALSLTVLFAAGFVTRTLGISLPSSRVLVSLALILVQNASFLIGLWAFGLRKHRAGLDQVGLRPFVTSAGCSYAGFGLLLSFGFNAFYNLVAAGLGASFQPTRVLPIFGGGLGGFAIGLVVASLLAPLIEEMFFRGFLLPGLVRRFGFSAGALISAAIFGGAHLNAASFLPLTFFGLVLAILYRGTGSIYPGIMLHSVNNSIALLVSFLMENDVLSGM